VTRVVVLQLFSKIGLGFKLRNLLMRVSIR
jgi:hypothetical protein